MIVSDSFNRRVGKFKLPMMACSERRKYLPIFAQCVVTFTHTDFSYANVIYFAHSDLFEEIGEHCDPPEYNLTIHLDGTVTAERIDKADVHDALVKALRNDSDWMVSKHTARHKSGISIWIANGRANLRADEASAVPFKLKWWQKYRLWKCIEKMLNTKAANKLNEK